MNLTVLGLAFVFVAAGYERVSARPNELGHPIVREFPPGKAAVGYFCPAVIQDAAGFIYIASRIGVGFYDGATFQMFEVPTESAGVRKFAVTADDTIFMGGAGVIGYLRGSGNNRAFVSLAERLPPTERGYDDIFDVLAVGNTVYFADEEKILIWRDQRFTVIPCPTPPQSRGARLHRVGNIVYVTALDRALCRLVHDRLETVADDPVFRQNQIVSIEAGPAGALVLLTAERGFFQFAAGHTSPLPIEANRWLAGKGVLQAQRLGDGSLVVAFTSVSGDGGMRFDSRGQYLGPIDNSTGLYVKTIRGFFCDREGGLWLGTEAGVFRLEWPSAVTVFDAVNGLGLGAVADTARHEGVLYAATSEGVYRLAASDDQDGRCARFERVHSFPTYALVSHPGGLLALGYAEVFAQTAAGFSPVAKLPPSGGTMYRSKRDPSRVWVNTAHGGHALRHTIEGWRDEGLAANIEENPREAPHVTDASRLRLPQWVKETAGPIAQLREEEGPDGTVLWICGANGLFRVDLARDFPAPVPFAALLTATGVRAGDRLTPEHPTLTFAYVALRHQLANSVAYQTRLVGHDDEWSQWSPKRERSFTSLPPARYRFEVRARDANSHLSAPATFAFTVLAPWWRTSWAIFGYITAGLALMAGVVRLRTRALQQRAERLEGVVHQRTAELAQRNAELVRLHQLELDEKTAARLAEEKARLEVLRYQLNPHFLFNTLASISSALPSTQSTARTMVERLANFCRLTLHRTDDREWTTLGEEMQLLRVYLEIEQSRWGDLLDVAIACDPALEAERLPHFLLLPLVENALKYGRATSPDRVGLRLVARRETRSGTASRSDTSGSPSTNGTPTSRGSATGGEVLILEVSNTGTWIEPGEKKTVSSLGIGLDNLRERLVRYYPRTHVLTVTPADGWVTVELRLTRFAPSAPP